MTRPCKRSARLPLSPLCSLLPLVLLLLCHILSTSAISGAPTVAELLQQASSQHVLAPSAYTKQHPSIPVLGYVTPWNPRGKELVERFRQKFDIVSPVWHTVHIDRDHKHGPTTGYSVKGGPTSPDDEAWYRRLQQPSAASLDRPIKVTPRFLLDDWQQEDYVDLLSNPKLWSLLARLLSEEVQRHGYDGLVLESSATYLLQEPLARLAEALRSAGKQLILVLPPLRTRTSLGVRPSSIFESQNAMILQSLPALSQIADYFSIMTYDMTGAGGRECPLKPSDLPATSPLRQAERGSLRIPGPNTLPSWIRETLLTSLKAIITLDLNAERPRSDPIPQLPFLDPNSPSLDPTNPFPPPSSPSSETSLPTLASKLLMGLPLYSYTYPLLFLNQETGQAVALTPTSPILSDPTTVPLLRGPGSPLTHPEVIHLLKTHRPTRLEVDEESGESFFDYLQEVAPDPSGNVQAGTGREGDRVFWRAYIPTALSQDRRIEAVQHVEADLDLDLDPDLLDGFDHDHSLSGGLALWEVGQAGQDLLAAL